MLNELRKEIEEAAFMLVDDARRKAIHSKLVRCLILLDKENYHINQDVICTEEDSVSEIKKVLRRLRMWSKPERQSQYNSQILNAYLELKRQGKKGITEDDIDSRLGHKSWFSSNFVQMKVIADRNHGKVFDIDGQFVNIWGPIKAAIDEYESVVFRSV